LISEKSKSCDREYPSASHNDESSVYDISPNEQSDNDAGKSSREGIACLWASWS
jgi:hypothetical protein